MLLLYLFDDLRLNNVESDNTDQLVLFTKKHNNSYLDRLYYSAVTVCQQLYSYNQCIYTSY